MDNPSPDFEAEFDLGFDPVAATTLRRVGGKGSLGPVVHEGSYTWRAVRTDKGEASLRLSPLPLGVAVQGWGPGATHAAGQVPELLGASDDPDALVPRDRVVAGLLAGKSGNYRMTRTNSIWEHIIPIVLGQKVPVASAARSWQAILRAWGSPAPGPTPPTLRLPPHPEAIAALGYHQLHPMNVERKRATVIIEAARRSTALEGALQLKPDDARRRLEAIRGIGPWTSSIVTQLALGDPDAVIVGDYNIPSLVSWNLAGERKADDARMLELLEPYRGQRARVQNLLKFGAGSPPRRGPKLDLVDLTDR